MMLFLCLFWLAVQALLEDCLATTNCLVCQSTVLRVIAGGGGRMREVGDAIYCGWCVVTNSSGTFEKCGNRICTNGTVAISCPTVSKTLSKTTVPTTKTTTTKASIATTILSRTITTPSPARTASTSSAPTTKSFGKTSTTASVDESSTTIATTNPQNNPTTITVTSSGVVDQQTPVAVTTTTTTPIVTTEATTTRFGGGGDETKLTTSTTIDDNLNNLNEKTGTGSTKAVGGGLDVGVVAGIVVFVLAVLFVVAVVVTVVCRRRRADQDMKPHEEPTGVAMQQKDDKKLAQYGTVTHLLKNDDNLEQKEVFVSNYASVTDVPTYSSSTCATKSAYDHLSALPDDQPDNFIDRPKAALPPSKN